MKINGRKNASQVGSFGPIHVQHTTEESSAADGPAAGDKVDLSGTEELKQLNATVKAMPAVRTEKVADLRDAIDDGSYYVESDKLARKVVDDVLGEALLRKS